MLHEAASISIYFQEQVYLIQTYTHTFIHINTHTYIHTYTQASPRSQHLILANLSKEENHHNMDSYIRPFEEDTHMREENVHMYNSACVLQAMVKRALLQRVRAAKRLVAVIWRCENRRSYAHGVFKARILARYAVRAACARVYACRRMACVVLQACVRYVYGLCMCICVCVFLCEYVYVCECVICRR